MGVSELVKGLWSAGLASIGRVGERVQHQAGIWNEPS